MSKLSVKLSGLSLTKSRSQEPNERSFPPLWTPSTSQQVVSPPKSAPLPPPPATGILLNKPTSPSPSRPPTPSLVRPDSSAICSSGSDDSHEEAGRVITPSPSSGRKIRFAPLPDPKRARSYSTGRNVWLDPNDPTSQRVTTRDDSLERRTTGEPMSRVRSAPTTSGSRPQETVDGFYTGPLLQPGGVSRTESHTGGFSPGSLPSSAHTRSGSTSSSFSRKFLAPLVGLGGSSRGSNATDESDDTSPIRRGNSGSSFNSDALLTPGSDSGASGFGAALAPSTSPRVSYPSVAQRSGGRRRAQPSSASKNEPVFQEWDFGGKSSSAHFNSSVVGRGGASFRGGSAPDHDAEDDDDGSGMAWLKRRKAERERKAKEEAEAAAAGVEVKKEVEEEEMTASPASQVTTPPIPIAGASPTKPSHRPTPSIEIDGVDVGKVTQQPDRPVMDENAVEDDDDEDDEGSNDEDDLSPEELAREEALAQEQKTIEATKGTMGAEKYRDHEHVGGMRRIQSAAAPSAEHAGNMRRAQTEVASH